MEDFSIGILFGCLLGFLFGMLLVSTTNFFGIETDIIKLGQSICDQEYDMDYDIYYKGVLKCKPKEVKEEVAYDGIVIQIKDGG